jgi:hypothetical protein
MRIKRTLPEEVTYQITLTEQDVATLKQDRTNLSKRFAGNASAPDSGVQLVYQIVTDILHLAP